jgi:dihydrofolate synthase / folylpolyglutamate synthase
MISTYHEAVDFLYQNLPIFQRVGAAAYKEDLDNTIALCAFLANPERKFKSIHIAGTNGKGSSSHMIASVLQSAGYKTGLYTSPHLKSFTERIRINGEAVPEQFVVEFVNHIRPAIEKIKPSFFEITVAMAFEYFAQQKVDIAVVEVGLGGRLDSTNVITPELSLITNIGWDHKDILGDSLEKIASEKAGIIKAGVPVVISERQKNIEDVFATKAQLEKSPIYFSTDSVVVEQAKADHSRTYAVTGDKIQIRNLALPLQGKYQRKNVGGVIKSLEVLQTLGYHIPTTAIKMGLEKVVQQTHLKGRWQKLSDKPLVICDTGHNIDGVKEIFGQISEIKFDNLHVVWGMVKDKDVTDILNVLPKNAKYYFCQANIPRAMEASVLAEKALATGLSGVVVPDVNDAMKLAISRAMEDDLVFVGGSTYVVAEIEEL